MPKLIDSIEMINWFNYMCYKHLLVAYKKLWEIIQSTLWSPDQTTIEIYIKAQ